MLGASLLSILLACTSGSVVGDAPSTPDDPAEDEAWDALWTGAYDPTRLLEVEVELDPEDWDTLRHQERNVLEMLTGECLAEPFESPYTWFEATVRIDGTTLSRVGVRKKGLLGSVEPARPSLKLEFDEYVDGQAFEGLERLTLNNSRQDPSRIKQCMGYELYARAGLPGSRCNFAHVTVNGEDLGIYANVEPIKPAMLRQHFEDEDGNLYEGTLSDFREGWTGTFDDKSDESDFSDIDAVVAALQVPDDELEEALEAVVDLDAFFQTWAMEALLGHWDSYTANTNNFFVYADPADGRFHFLPWGIDAILEGEEPFGAGQPTVITAHAALPARLATVPALEDRYYAALDRLLEEVWDEDLLLDRLDAMTDLTRDQAWPEGNDNGSYQDTLERVEDFIEDRRERIEDELAQGRPAQDGSLVSDPCLVDLGWVEGSFETTWGSYGTEPTFSHGDGSWSLRVGEDSYPLEFLGAVVGETPDGTLMLVTGRLEWGSAVALYVLADDPEDLGSEGTVPVDWGEVSAYLIYNESGELDEWAVWAYLGGALELERASLDEGGIVSGRFGLTVYGGSG